MINFVYDPKRQGYSTTFWKSLTGTPTIVNDKIVLNADSMISYADLTKCDLKVSVKIPAVPTIADSRQIGFANISKGAFLIFDITGTAFTIYSDDGEGNTKSEQVTFDPAWAATDVDFEIRWRGSYADFYVNDIRLIPYRINDAAIPSGSLSIYINNNNADDMLVNNIEAKNIESLVGLVGIK